MKPHMSVTIHLLSDGGALLQILKDGKDFGHEYMAKNIGEAVEWLQLLFGPLNGPINEFLDDRTVEIELDDEAA